MDWFHRASAAPAPAPAPVPAPASTVHEPSTFEQLAHGHGGQLAADLTDAVAHEGLIAMLDGREGALDRVRARRELAPMFTVRDANAPHDRLSGLTNTVTPEEFERVSRTYSEIRRGESHLKIDNHDLGWPLERHYDDLMLHDVANIMQTRSGRELVEGLAHPVRADGGPIHDTQIGLYGATDNAFTYSRGFLEGHPENYEHGVGTNTEVVYTPGDAGGARTSQGNIRSDVTLYHELTHALHRTHGSLSEGIIGNKHWKENGGFMGDYQVESREAQASGLYDYAHAAISENHYRQERQQVAESGVGARERVMSGGNVVADGDADIQQRARYSSPVPPAPPEPWSPRLSFNPPNKAPRRH